MGPLEKAFDHFKAKRANKRWSWSGLNMETKTVVLTLWEDEISDLNKLPVVYSNRGKNVHLWADKLGNKERIKYLKWARAHCNSQFKVIITIARDPKKRPKTIKKCYPAQNLVMRLTYFNEVTGDFCAESVKANVLGNPKGKSDRPT